MVPVLASLTSHSTGCREYILPASDLSNVKSLRSLEIEFTLTSVARRYRDETSTLEGLLSTVTSPVFSDVVIILRRGIINDAEFLQCTLFRVVRNMYRVKPFRLTFWQERSPRDGEDDVERLKEMIRVQAAEGGLGLDPPVIVSYAQTALWRAERLLKYGPL